MISKVALKKLIVHSLEVSSKGLREFHQSSLTTMSGEVLKYEKIINGTLTKIEQSKLVTQTEKNRVDFEKRDQKVRESQNQLISEQKQAFTDFKSALKQVANRLLTVSGMFDKANELQDLKNHVDFIKSPFKDLSTFITLGKTVKDNQSPTKLNPFRLTIITPITPLHYKKTKLRISLFIVLMEQP